VGDQNTSFIVESILEDVLEDGFTDVGIKGGEGVVEYLNVGITVEGTANVEPLLLATRE